MLNTLFAFSSSLVTLDKIFYVYKHWWKLSSLKEWHTPSWNFGFHSWYVYKFLLKILFDKRCWIITSTFEACYLCDMSKNLRPTSLMNFFCRDNLLVKASSRYHNHIKIPRYGMVLMFPCKSWFPHVNPFAYD